MTKNVIWKKDVPGNSIHVYEYWKNKYLKAEVNIDEPTLLSENLLFEQLIELD